jgi:hypothetical protein
MPLNTVSFEAGRMPALLCQPAGCRRSFVSRQDAGAPLSAGRMPALLCQPAGCRRSSVSRQDAGAPLSAGKMPALLCQPARCRRSLAETLLPRANMQKSSERLVGAHYALALNFSLRTLSSERHLARARLMYVLWSDLILQHLVLSGR